MLNKICLWLEINCRQLFVKRRRLRRSTWTRRSVTSARLGRCLINRCRRQQKETIHRCPSVNCHRISWSRVRNKTFYFVRSIDSIIVMFLLDRGSFRWKAHPNSGPIQMEGPFRWRAYSDGGPLQMEDLFRCIQIYSDLFRFYSIQIQIYSDLFRGSIQILFRSMDLFRCRAHSNGRLIQMEGPYRWQGHSIHKLEN